MRDNVKLKVGNSSTFFFLIVYAPNTCLCTLWLSIEEKIMRGTPSEYPDVCVCVCVITEVGQHLFRTLQTHITAFKRR